ncbi:STAS domain-containing protein [Actinacidiphila acidipaludis]|uniref:STAS domain-containing protein n=1 Tax=Actinacidiphila acidipaludis TaxID=2873382 RepID=A0ABS7PZ84_9ACTN|nr:STAS domain-containing protein [Streptomyces acidipaludis]MBY8876205.1 STAS domain-containing protein [Streptomyces acidipaludis]
MIGIECFPSQGAPAELTAALCPSGAAASLTPASRVSAPPTSVSQGCSVKDLHSRLEVRLTETGGRALAAVVGEIDLGCAPLMERILLRSMADARDGLEVDLAGVGFLDCSGLNALLRVRQEAVTSRIPMKVTRISPAVRRMFELSGCEALFA